jgi:hypothetical protein
LAAMAGILAAFFTAPADASREPTRKEARAIKKGFMKPRDEGRTTIKRIRVSTVKERYAAVGYTVRLPEITTIGPTPARRAKETYKPPSPVILKKKSGKWKTVPKAPGKVKKDLKDKPGGRIDITGETSAVLSVPATCGESPGYYSAGIYDPVGDVYLSLQFPRWHGYGTYPALAVNSLAALSVGNMGGTPQWETGQGNDAFSPSGEIYVDPGRWGIIAATMARTGGVYPQSVSVNGYWDCR